MKALIIYDGSESLQSLALNIKESLNSVSSGIKTTICQAKDFKGNELLPADIFFIGCETPSPSSFSWLEDFFSHINLASRKCGIFSVKTKTVNYLRNILKNSEADIAEPFIAENGEVKKAGIKKWLKLFLGKAGKA